MREKNNGYAKSATSRSTKGDDGSTKSGKGPLLSHFGFQLAKADSNQVAHATVGPRCSYEEPRFCAIVENAKKGNYLQPIAQLSKTLQDHSKAEKDASAKLDFNAAATFAAKVDEMNKELDPLKKRVLEVKQCLYESNKEMKYCMREKNMLQQLNGN